MAQTIKLKRSATQNAVPTTSQLALGEVALNTYDGKMYIKKSVGGTESIVEIGGDATSSSGLDFTGNLNLEDNVRIVIGDGDDLQIYHDGSDSIINENGTGDLKVFSSRFRVISPAGEEMIRATADGAVDLYHNNSAKLATTSAGAQVSGKLFISDTSNGLEIGASKARFKVNGDDTVIDAIPTSGGINFRTGGAVQAAKIDSDGRLLVNTTSSIDNLAKIQVVGDSSSLARITLQDVDGTNQKTFFEQSGGGTRISTQDGTSNGIFTIGAWNGTASSDFVRVTSTGRVGIGTTSPGEKLHVSGGNIKVATTDIPAKILLDDSRATAASEISQRSDGRLSLAAVAGSYGTTGIEILSNGNVGIRTTTPYAGAKMQICADDTSPSLNTTAIDDCTLILSNSDDDYGTVFATDGTGKGYIQQRRMAVATYYDLSIQPYGGNVGIGISAPTTPLAVQSNSSAQGITILGRSSDDISQLDFVENDGTSIGGIQARTTDFRIRSVSNIPLLFMTNNTERARIDANGSVFIASTSDSGSNRHYFQHDGFFRHVRSGQLVGVVDRLSSDGDIFKIRKDGSDIATLGSNQNQFLIDSNAGNIVISANNGSSSIITKGTLRPLTDNTNDLGISTRRYQDLFLAGTIYGGSTLTLDPAAHGDDTGTVVIAGNLQVDGTTTTINSTTLTVDDKNITLASGSTNAAAANGAGLTVDCGSDTDATFTYDGTNDEWDFNKDVNVTGTLTASGGAANNDNTANILTLNASEHARLLVDTTSTSSHRATLALKSNGNETQLSTTGSASFLNVASGDLTLDVAGDIILDADGGDVLLKDGGTFYGFLGKSGNDLVLKSQISDGDFAIKGNDGGSTITALLFDMSQAGRATFNEGIVLKSSTAGDFGVNINTASGDFMKLQVVDTGSAGAAHGSIEVSDGNLTLDVAGDIILDADGRDVYFADGGTNYFQVYNDVSNNAILNSVIQDKDIKFTGNDGGSTITALTLDMSDAGAATFNSSITVTGTNANLTLGATGNNITFGRNGDNYIEAQAGTSSNIVIDPQNRFVVRTNDTERFRIDGAGNILHQSGSPEYHFGTDSASHYNWRVAAQEAVDAGFEIASGTQSAGSGALSDTYTTRFVIKGDTGNVGIGTTSPDNKLHVYKGDSGHTWSFDGGDGLILENSDSLSINITTPAANSGNILFSDANARGQGRIVYDHSADYMGFMTAGVSNEHMRIDSSGRVGIGTTSPAKELDVLGTVRAIDANSDQHQLRPTQLISYGTDAIVNAQSAGDDVLLRTQGNTRLIATAEGNVGIGTTSPSHPLHISKSVNDTTLLGLSYSSSDSGAADYAHYGELLIQGGGTYNKAGIRGYANAYQTGNAALAFWTQEHGGSYAERMRIMGDGKVGIGTSSPENLLHLASSSDYDVVFDRVGQEKFRLRHGTSGLYLTGPDTNTLAFGVDHNHDVRMFNTSGSAYAVFDGSTSRVAVGTTTPGRTFHVVSSDYSVARLERTGAGGGVALEFRNGDGNIWQIGNDGDEVLRFYYAGSNKFQITSSGAARFNSAFTLPTSDGQGNQVLQTDGSGNVSWATISGVGTATTISDADGDTKIQTEESSDEDKIRFDVAGTERVVVDGTDFIVDNIALKVKDPGGTFSWNVNKYGYNTTRSSSITQLSGTGDHAMLPFSILADVSSSRTKSYMEVGDIGSAGNRFKLTNTGRVGVGITSPSTKFQVKSEGADDGLYFVKSDNSNLLGGIIQTGSGDGALVARNTSNSQTVLLRGQGNNYITGGNVGIGTTSPSSTLHVQNTSTNSEVMRLTTTGDDPDRNMYFQSDHIYSNGNLYWGIGNHRNLYRAYYHTFHYGTSNTEAMRIHTDGNVGIGTSSPSAPLHVVGEDSGITISSDISDRPHLSLVNGTSEMLRLSANNIYGAIGDSTDSQRYMVFKDGNVGIGTTSPNSYSNQKVLTINGTTHSRIDFETADTLRGSIYGDSGSLNLDAGGNYIRFYAGNTQKMTLLANGKVGIGITTPTAALSVVDTSQTTTGQGLAGLRVHRPNATSQYGYVDYDHNGGGINVGSFYSGGGNSVYGTFMFRQHNAAGSQTPMAIGNTGNVGFGTTSPADKMHLSGGNLLFERGVELRSKDTGGNLRTLVRVNSSNELEYGWSASGPVKFMGGTSYTERMRIHTNGYVGINETSPSHRFQVAVDANGAYIKRDVGSNAANLSEFNSHRSLLLLNRNSGSYLAFGGNSSRTDIQATDLAGTPTAKNIILNPFGGSVGVGVTSPGGVFDVDGTYGDFTVGNPSIGSRLTYYDTTRITLDSNNIYFYTNSLTERMRIDSSGKVGIGTTSLSSITSSVATLSLGGTNAATSGGIAYQTNGTPEAYHYTSGDFLLHQAMSGVGQRFLTNNVERMRINSSGDWMVSNTVANVASAYNNQGGCGWVDSDNHFEAATTSNRSAAEFGRNNGNSGDVITIRQQGNSIGMIGTEGGDSLVIQSNGSTGTGIRFHPSRAAVEPVRAGATIDDTISLGADTRRFKDLHLSNAANIGHASIETSSTSTTATTQVAIATFAAATFRGAEFTIQVTNSTDSTYHLTKVLLIHDGTTPGITEYGTVFTGSAAEATFDADISSGNVRLLATPASTDSMTFKVVRHCITV